MPIDADIDAGYSGPGGGGYSGNPRGEPSGFSGGGWNSVTEGGGSDRNRPRRRRRKMKLPAEYADFKLADGRTLREVMGDKFFGSAGGSGGGKWMSKGVRERLRQGGGPFRGGMFENSGPERPTRLRARAEARWAKQPGGNFSFGGRL